MVDGKRLNLRSVNQFTDFRSSNHNPCKQLTRGSTAILPEKTEMKALLVLAAVAGTAFVGYSYTSTDGQSCAVCPLTGEPLMTATETEGSCCASQNEAMLTGIDGEPAACCSEADGPCCSKSDAAMLTGIEGEAPSCCSKGEDGTCAKGEGCCQKADAAMLTSIEGDVCEEGCTKGCCKENAEIAAEEGGNEGAGVLATVEEIE